MESQRIDKWLWAARFYKTRSLAADELGLNRIRMNDRDAKPSSDVKVGAVVQMRRDGLVRTVIVKGLSAQRGPAPVAQQLYEETAESLLAVQQHKAQRQFFSEPAHAIEKGRPTKRDRRELTRESEKNWDSRWRASVE
jgi:ribosome-associated heat shock protein Hsp15